MSDETPQKRARTAQACESCRARKVKCDGRRPCSQCARGAYECSFKDDASSSQLWQAQQRIQELEEKEQRLLALLAREKTTNAPDDTIGTRSFAPALPDSSRQTNCPDGLGSLPAYDRTEQQPQPTPPWCEAVEPVDDVDGTTSVSPSATRVEFHGNTSSIAMLDEIRRRHRNKIVDTGSNSDSAPSIISDLQNIAFSPDAQVEKHSSAREEQRWLHVAHIFFNGYLDSLHYVHPFLEVDHFLRRASLVWSGRAEDVKPSFKAFYFAVLSLGALTRTWNEDRIDGLTRFEWSRKLFHEAELLLQNLQFSSDIETVQCLFIMAKICQNELNLHLAYMYLGQAVRTSLAAGFNRGSKAREHSYNVEISRTWWALYSLEIEMSFSLGRPDTLGRDEYHTIPMPEIRDMDTDIIPYMVPLGRLIRKLVLCLYQSNMSLEARVEAAFQIEQEIDSWRNSLPLRLRQGADSMSERSRLSTPKWARRQALVLQMRIFNIKMLLFKPFLGQVSSRGSLQAAELSCVDATTSTIDLVYEIFQHHTFFQSWWYNITYVTFASSILLLAKILMKRPVPVTSHLEKAIEVLNTMLEHQMAGKFAEALRRSLPDSRSREDDCNADQQPSNSVGTTVVETNLELPFASGLIDGSMEEFSWLFDTDEHTFRRASQGI